MYTGNLSFSSVANALVSHSSLSRNTSIPSAPLCVIGHPRATTPFTPGKLSYDSFYFRQFHSMAKHLDLMIQVGPGKEAARRFLSAERDLQFGSNLGFLPGTCRNARRVFSSSCQ